MAGYEKLAGLMTKHTEVATFQRFRFLNTLNILYLQAELVHLEQELRDSMQEDLESVNTLASVLDEAGPLSQCKSEENLESLGYGHEGPVEDEIEKRPISQIETRSVSSTESEINERVVSARDWYFLANMDDTSTWDIMLKTREKLKEYNATVLRYKEMNAEHSPNACDVNFLRRWFQDKNMGNFPLIGKDSTLWESSVPSDLVAVRARRAEDPLGTLFLSRVFLWWHQCIGHRIKKPVDEEAQYIEYRDTNVLRVANIFGSIVSSGLLVASIMVLYFVDNPLARLGIVAAFTQVFSLLLMLATNARKVEVFAATAAFVAVQVVFVGSTIN